MTYQSLAPSRRTSLILFTFGYLFAWDLIGFIHSSPNMPSGALLEHIVASPILIVGYTLLAFAFTGSVIAFLPFFIGFVAGVLYLGAFFIIKLTSSRFLLSWKYTVSFGGVFGLVSFYLAFALQNFIVLKLFSPINTSNLPIQLLLIIGAGLGALIPVIMVYRKNSN
jgi:hypothetical protein